jgi:hypothetical protein
MAIDRREFISTAASALALGGCTTDAFNARNPESKFCWSYLVHFGVNCWRDVPLETQDPSKPEKQLRRCCANHIRFDERLWNRLSDALAKAGCNQIVVDLAEFVEYPSHPELAVKGSWSVDKLRSEIARLRGMGFEVIPKLNFSACHDTWLKDYHRMVSTRKYYQVCEDLIKDVAEIFDHPRYFHLGYDEETYWHQAKHHYVVCRQGELWWHDFLWFVKVTEKTGCRPWIWSDCIWRHKDEFLKRMPKSVLQSNWYYESEFNCSKMKYPYYIEAYDWLHKAGFEQVPTGSNVCCDTNFADTVRYCDEKCGRNSINGYLMTTWLPTVAIHEEKFMQAVNQLAAVANPSAIRR